MEEKPLVSIIIPAYNADAYIEEAISSALEQTYKNCEVVVVDDGSTDDTKRVLRQYIKRGQIKYIFQANKGLAGARNTGVRTAKGEFIAFLDADDIFLPTKVEKQVAELSKRPDFGACYCDILHFTDTAPRKFYHHSYRYPSGDVFAFLLQRQFVNPLTLLVRRQVFQEYGYFDENLRRSEDWDLWLRWAHAGVKFYYLDKILAHYRMRDVGNLSSIESEPQMKEKNLIVFSRLGKNLSEEEWRRYDFQSILNLLRIKTAFAYLMVGDKSRALELAKESWLWKTIIRLLPGLFWKKLLQYARRLKHRLLLRKL